jgi:hypothetical protein
MGSGLNSNIYVYKDFIKILVCYDVSTAIINHSEE